MEGIMKMIKIVIMVIGAIWLLGAMISIIPEDALASAVTIAIIFFAIYGIRAFVKNHKEGS